MNSAADGSALGAPDGGITSPDHSTLEGVADEPADGTLFRDTDGAADGLVDGAADGVASAHLTAASTAQTIAHSKA